MKTLRFWLIASGVLTIFANFDITSAKTKTERAAKKIDDEKSLISTHEALQDFKLYLNKQIAKHNLKLSQEQIDAFITQSRSLIYEGSRDGKISQKSSRKIQKDFKIYLKTTYPDNFKLKRAKTEVNYKLARRRIRATTKDFISDKLQIKNIPEFKERWNSVKDLIYKKLDKAAYFNDFNELVVDESTIAEIISNVFEKLETEKLANSEKLANNLQNPNNLINRKHKAAVPTKISLPIAEKLVRLMIRNKGISAKHNEELTPKIMAKVSKNIKKGRVEKSFVVQTTNQEIKNFIELKNKVTKTPKQRYLDRFIAAMAKTPETDMSE